MDEKPTLTGAVEREYAYAQTSSDSTMVACFTRSIRGDYSVDRPEIIPTIVD